MKIAQGNGGWHQISGDTETGLPGVLYARATEVDGQLRLTELYIDGRGEPIRADALRALSVGLLEHYVTSSSTINPNTIGIDLSTLASYFATTFGKYKGKHCKACDAPLMDSPRVKTGLPPRPLTDWVALAWHAQVENAFARRDKRKPRIPLPVRRGSPEFVEPPQEIELGQPVEGLTDAFLKDVSRAYDACISQGLPPAVTLAKMVGVDQKTVQAWFHKARRRTGPDGAPLMPPAKRKGRIV